MKLTIIPFLLISIIVLSCKQNPNKQIDEGTVIKGQIYHSDEVGWTIVIPEGWKISDKDIVEANEEKGKALLEKTSGTEIDVKGLKHLISFQKDKFNNLAATTEPFKEDHPGQYEESVKDVSRLIYDAYKSQGIKADTSSGMETVNGLPFHVFYSTIHAPDGKVILHQLLYSRLVNDLDFGVNINYNNEEDQKTLLDAWRDSKFEGKLQ